jgi:delta 1-pyrroline-5-carboxylate dehydrogenase
MAGICAASRSPSNALSQRCLALRQILLPATSVQVLQMLRQAMPERQFRSPGSPHFG